MNRIDMPNSACRSFISLRICAWMVTSSAVVGSSAIRIAGRQISAMAIMARWRRPPESSNGKKLTACSGAGKSDPAQHLDGPSSRRCGVDAMMKHQRLADLVADRVQGRQRAHRLLEDDRNPPAANVAALCAVLRERGEIEDRTRALGVVEPDRAAGDPGIGRQDAQDRLRDHGLARAALADNRHGSVGREVERHAGHGLDLALVGGKGDAQIADRQQRLDHRPSPNSAPAAASVARG